MESVVKRRTVEDNSRSSRIMGRMVVRMRFEKSLRSWSSSSTTYLNLVLDDILWLKVVSNFRAIGREGAGDVPSC